MGQNNLQQTCAKCGHVGPYTDFYWVPGRKKPTSTCTECYLQDRRQYAATRIAKKRKETGVEKQVEREKIHDVPHEEHCQGCHLYKVTTSWHYPSCYFACVRREDLN